MKYFFSTGEASGEVAAVLLAQAIARIDSDARFEGIGSQLMLEHHFRLWRDHRGWASMGPVAAIPRIPKLLYIMFRTAAYLRRAKPDLIVLVDFGAFNLRLAKRLRRLGYGGPILDLFPPGTWLDREKTARAVASSALPLTAFEHQREFYRSLGLPIAYFGHPLVSQYTMRAARNAPPDDAGCVAILPGSRGTELRRHIPLLVDAFNALQRIRPAVSGVAGAADERAERALREAFVGAGARSVRVVRGVRAAIEDADAAWVSSGTAVLECALSGVPSIALYVVSPSIAKHARRVYSGTFVTIPNLVLQRELVPEFLQERATPSALAGAMHELLKHPEAQTTSLPQLRRALGPPDALDRCAAYAVRLASAAA